MRTVELEKQEMSADSYLISTYDYNNFCKNCKRELCAAIQEMAAKVDFSSLAQME